MGLILWILFGAAVGWAANALTGKQGSGCITNIIVGMVGSIIGGLIVTFITFGGVDVDTFVANLISFNLISFLVSIVGAVVFLAIVNAVRK